MMLARAARVAALTACACSSDFLIDDGTTGTTGGADSGSTSGVATTLPSTSSAEGSGSSATDSTTAPQDTGDVETTSVEGGSTGAVEGSATEPTTGVEATAEATVEGSAGSTTGELPCAELDMEPCTITDGCVWEGELCMDDPCFDPTDGGSECLDMAFAMCLENPGCAWMGVPKDGACAPNGCWPCESLANEVDCTGTDGCMWLEGEASCMPV